jgi:nicotinate-nucleotide adenylyltransferase
MNIGLFFGSFNPVHIGHLALANYLLEFVPFREIWFIVSPQNPFKTEEALAPARQRLAMVSQSVSPESRFKVSDVEFDLPRPSYTIDTLEVLSHRHPQSRFSLIMGSDNLTRLDRWKSWNELAGRYPIVVYPRPGHPVLERSELPHPNITVVEAPLLDLSSTLLREGLMAGKNLRFLMPPGIYEYIRANHLYGI